MLSNQEKDDDAADDKSDVIFGEYGVVGCQVRRCKRLFQRPGQQVKIDGHNKTASDDPPRERGGGKQYAAQTGHREKDPIGASDELYDPLLDFHRSPPVYAMFTIFGSFYCQADVFVSSCDSKP